MLTFADFSVSHDNLLQLSVTSLSLSTPINHRIIAFAHMPYPTRCTHIINQLRSACVQLDQQIDSPSTQPQLWIPHQSRILKTHVAPIQTPHNLSNILPRSPAHKIVVQTQLTDDMVENTQTHQHHTTVRSSCVHCAFSQSKTTTINSMHIQKCSYDVISKSLTCHT